VASDHLENQESGPRPPAEAQIAASSTGTDAPAAEALSNEVALLCLSAAGREPQYFGPSSALSFSMIASSVMGLPRQAAIRTSDRDTGGGVRGDLRTMSRTRSKTRLMSEFPSASKVAQLSQAYFKSTHPQYPFLHRQTIQAMENKCLEANLKGDDMSLFFVLMVRTLPTRSRPAAEGEKGLCYRLIGPWEG
jgi:hypothetical protein